MTCDCIGPCGGPCNDAHGRSDFQYAVKTVCGVVAASVRPPNPLPPGQYFTAVNVHNPSRCDAVILRWKAAVGLPALTVGPVSEYASATLGPDEALEIDCSDVRALLSKTWPHMPSYVKGWVIIEAPAQLDVVAVYGTAASEGDAVNTLHTERVEPRCLVVCDDFELDISTGVAAWNVKGPAPTDVFVPATLRQPATSPKWTNAPPGSLWVDAATEQTAGDYTYRVEFHLCSGFENPRLELAIAADYYAKVYLNGNPANLLGTTPTPGYSGMTTLTASSHFKAGLNVLEIVVTNTEEGSPTGLLVQGLVEVTNGLCAGQPYPLLICPQVCYSLRTRRASMNPFGGVVIDNDQNLEGPGCNGAEIGNTDGEHRSEQFEVHLTGSIPSGSSIEYRVYERTLAGVNGSWTGWKSAGLAGTVGIDHPITAIQIKGKNLPVDCNLRYRVATRPRLTSFGLKITWSQYVHNNQIAGSTNPIGFPKRYPPIVAVAVEIV